MNTLSFYELSEGLRKIHLTRIGVISRSFIFISAAKPGCCLQQAQWRLRRHSLRNAPLVSELAHPRDWLLPLAVFINFFSVKENAPTIQWKNWNPHAP